MWSRLHILWYFRGGKCLLWSEGIRKRCEEGSGTVHVHWAQVRRRRDGGHMETMWRAELTPGWGHNPKPDPLWKGQMWKLSPKKLRVIPVPLAPPLLTPLACTCLKREGANFTPLLDPRPSANLTPHDLNSVSPEPEALRPSPFIQRSWESPGFPTSRGKRTASPRRQSLQARDFDGSHLPQPHPAYRKQSPFMYIPF